MSSKHINYDLDIKIYHISQLAKIIPPQLKSIYLESINVCIF